MNPTQDDFIKARMEVFSARYEVRKAEAKEVETGKYLTFLGKEHPEAKSIASQLTQANQNLRLAEAKLSEIEKSLAAEEDAKNRAHFKAGYSGPMADFEDAYAEWKKSQRTGDPRAAQQKLIHQVF